MTTESVPDAVRAPTADLAPPPWMRAPTGRVTRISTALLAHLQRDALIELDEGADPRQLADALAGAVVGLATMARPGKAFADWLVDRDEVSEVFGSDFAIDTSLRAAVSAADVAERVAAVAAAATIATRRRSAKRRQ